VPAIVPRCQKPRRSKKFFCIFFESWIKIQVLDERSVRPPLHARKDKRHARNAQLTTASKQILDLVQSAIERTGGHPPGPKSHELGFRSANARKNIWQAWRARRHRTGQRHLAAHSLEV